MILKSWRRTSRRAAELLREIESKVGAIPDKLEQQLIEKLGVEDGEVLRPVVDAVTRASRATTDKLVEVKEQLDPTKDDNCLGRALRTLGDLLDADRTDSVQGRLDAAVTSIIGSDGPLVKTVKAAVTEAVNPLKERVDVLAREVHGKEAAEEAVAETTRKGAPFEELVVRDLQPWAETIGAELCHVGGDSRKGDITVTLTGTSIASTDLCIVIEARNRRRAMGGKAISEDLSEKMVERGANAAIYLCRGPDGLGAEIGEWGEGVTAQGPWVATTLEHLRAALRFLIAMHKVRSIRESMPEVDVSFIESQIKRIRTAVKALSTIKRKTTDIEGLTTDIATVAKTVREEVGDALFALEEALRRVAPDDGDAAAA
jgi:hypothetical protein